MQLYKWLQSQTTADIYVWGHSLGTALSTHTVKMLKSEGIIPYGLALESPFTTMREEITLHPIGRVRDRNLCVCILNLIPCVLRTALLMVALFSSNNIGSLRKKWVSL